MAGKFWTQAWSVVSGCTPCSPGCDHCWAARELEQKPVLAAFHVRGETVRGVWPEPSIRLHPELLDRPSHWSRPRRIAVGWMGDLFHEAVPNRFVDSVLAEVEPNGQHHYLLLTKRAVRARHYFTGLDGELDGQSVWLGVTGEDQEHSDQRLAELAATRAPHRWLIAEPLLGPVQLGFHLDWLEWVVVGAETGPGARPCDVTWVASVVAQCRAAGVPVWVKAPPNRGTWAGILYEVFDLWPREMPAALRLPGEAGAPR